MCHPTIQPGSISFRDPASHINGTLDLGDGASCDSCHGEAGISAPPVDLLGQTERTAPGVGAHRQHLGPSDWHREVTCSNCHVVPTDVGDAGHIDGDNVAEVPFDSFNPQATYDRAATTCRNLYCHGDARGQNGTMNWVEDVTLTCTSCHSTGRGLGDEHGEHLGEGVSCFECHADVVDSNMNVIGAALHINARRDVRIRRGGTFDPATRRCTNLACHGAERW
jgi:predicted CxxxxCH...CXXCH cytochrome family protein